MLKNSPRFEVLDLVNRYRNVVQSKSHSMFSGIGLLIEAYRIAAGDKANPEVLKILDNNKAYQYFDGILSDEEMVFLANNLKEVYDNEIYSGVSPLPAYRQETGITEMMCAMAEFPEDVTVYNPFAGANSYAIALLKNRVEGEEIFPTRWALGQIRLFVEHAEERSDIALGDSFKAIASNKKYSAIITSPEYPVGEDLDFDIVRMLYDKLEDGGKLVCLVPNSFLSASSGNARLMRERLIKEKAVRAVVMLPTLNYHTWARQSIMLITKGDENENILFADATKYIRFAASRTRTDFDYEEFWEELKEEFEYENEIEEDEARIGRFIAYSELVDAKLIPFLYLHPHPQNGIPLSELATYVRPLKNDTPIPSEGLFTVSALSAMHGKPYIPNKVEGNIGNRYMLDEGVVIIDLRGGKIRSVYTEGFVGQISVHPFFIKVLRPKDGIEAKYLAALLATEIVAAQINAHLSVLDFEEEVDLEQIYVPLHDTDESRIQLISEVIASEMGDLEKELQDTLDNQKREIRSTRHAMIQTLFALSSNWDQLKMFAESKEEGIKLTDTIGRINPISVKNLMGSIDHAVSTLQRQVEALRLEKSDWGQDVAINPYDFINKYIDKHGDPLVRMMNVGDKDVEVGDKKVLFYAPERLLERIFDNIVANAKAHGFCGGQSDNEIRFDYRLEDGAIVITVANNGFPLKQGVSGADVLMRGFSTALNEDAADGTLHSGQGGFEIKSLMEDLGSVEVISQPDAEFPVTYKLVFTKADFENFKNLNR